MVRASERAARVIAQLLALVRAEGASTAFTPVDLGALAQDRLAALGALAARRQVELELDAEPGVRVSGQLDLLVSLLDNLIDNAVKYSPPAATVRVQVRRAGSHARLSVHDQGPGIPVPLRERVFDRFYRAPDQTESGSGLGLAIVRANAQRHGARVRLADGEGARGLVVTVSFPHL
ncbi:MAG: sensor histidine kinase [Gammaproteobacteria bacterium]